MPDTLQIPAAAPLVDAPACLVFPGDDGWDESRRAWNLAVEQHPVAVALPESAAEVAAVVRWARANGFRVAPQGTGHGAAPLAGLGRAVLLKTHRMREVSVDPVARVARAAAGALWGDVVAAAAPHGLAALAGSSHDVGVVGYTLGGGLSLLARSHGIACNRVVAAEVVTARGEIVRADREHHAELFWALRGGGGSFGVVTAIELELLDLPTVFAGTLFFPVERAAEALHAWREWTATVPDSITSTGRILNFPPLPDLPPHLAGRSFALVEVVCTAGEAVGTAWLEPLRALGPEMDTCATIPSPDLLRLHMDPPQPVPARGDHQLLDSLPAAAIDAMVAFAGAGSGTSLVGYQIRHLGGAVARGHRDHGCLAAIDAPYATFGVGMAGTPEASAAVAGDLARAREAMAPWAAESAYLNFAERPVGVASLFDEDAYARLRILKGMLDPGELFLANHPIRPL